MKSTWWVITMVFILFGFIIPVLWIFAIIAAICAIASSPGGTRADGKPKSGGLFGGLWDAWLMHEKMRECPHCKSQILKDASRCRYCQAEVKPLVTQEQLDEWSGTKKFY